MLMPIEKSAPKAVIARKARSGSFFNFSNLLPAQMHHARQSSKTVHAWVLLLFSILASVLQAQQLTPQESGVVQAINQLRHDPVSWIRNLEWQRSLYRGNLLELPGHTRDPDHGRHARRG